MCRPAGGGLPRTPGIVDTDLNIQSVDMALFQRVAKHLPSDNDLTLITLKGHLLVEEILDSIIAKHCKDESALEGVDFRFQLKARLAAALTGQPELAPAWVMIDKLNALRNALAHKIEHPLAQRRLEVFLELFRHTEIKLPASSDNADKLRNSIAFLIGFVVGATQDKHID